MNIVNDKIVTKILTSKNPKNIQIKLLEWHVDNGILEAGNNYGSEVSRLTIDYENNGKKLTKIIFLKVICNSPMFERVNKDMDFMVKEPHIYSTILPQMYTLYDEYFTPRNYYIDDKHSLFLKDLSQSGYKMANRVEQLDFEHCALAFKCIAKFHAFSVHLEKIGAIPDHIKQELLIRSDFPDENWKTLFLTGPDKFFHQLDETIKEKYSKQLAHFKTITWDKLAQEVAPDPNSFNVLNHGDFWLNNMLYKYDKYGIVKKIKLIDFQACKWSSPAVDLLQFTISSMRFEIYEKYFNLLLEIYLNTLNKILSALDCATYSIEALNNDIDKKLHFSTIAYTIYLPFAIADPNDPIKVDELVRNGEVDSHVTDKMYHQSHYIEVATKWFLHFAQKYESLST